MKILTVAVHPDDETLGCGGTLLKHKANGDTLYWLIMTSALADQGYSPEFLSAREEQIEAVSQAYGFKQKFLLGFPTTRLHAIDFNDLLKAVSSVIQEVKPDIIYSNHRADIHSDHRVTSDVLFSAVKAFRNPDIHKIMLYETVSETDAAPPFPENAFLPTAYSNITEFLEEKLRIMSLYESEVQHPPQPRSLENIRALARYRGASIGQHYAEAFMTAREIF